MKLVVLSDVHANLAALEAVMADVDRWGADEVVVAGDLVNRGPQPRACLERLLERRDRHGWRLLRGNHEDFVLESAPPAAGGWEAELLRHTEWTRNQLDGLTAELGALPYIVEHPGPDGRPVRVTHASMKSPRHGLYQEMTDAELRPLIAPAPALLAVGHTHCPFVRTTQGTLVVNAGSTGLPFDGDYRAGYARLVLESGRWQARIVRVPYDRAATEEAFRTTGYLRDGGPMVRLILDELRRAGSWLSRWHRHWEPRVAAGELDVAASVDALLGAG